LSHEVTKDTKRTDYSDVRVRFILFRVFVAIHQG
jgi:hypothetical protein